MLQFWKKFKKNRCEKIILFWIWACLVSWVSGGDGNAPNVGDGNAPNHKNAYFCGPRRPRAPGPTKISIFVILNKHLYAKTPWAISVFINYLIFKELEINSNVQPTWQHNILCVQRKLYMVSLVRTTTKVVPDGVHTFWRDTASSWKNQDNTGTSCESDSQLRRLASLWSQILADSSCQHFPALEWSGASFYWKSKVCSPPWKDCSRTRGKSWQNLTRRIPNLIQAGETESGCQGPGRQGK